MKLISATPSPWARKVRILLLEKGLDVEIVNDVPWAPETVVPEFNPLEKLPILVTDTGEAIYESRLIVEWIERHFPEPPMIPRGDEEYLMAKKFEILADGILDASVLFFMEFHRTTRDAQWWARQGRKIVRGIAEVARLVNGGEFAVGKHFGLADAATCAMLSSMDYVSDTIGERFEVLQWRGNHPTLESYLQKHEQRPSLISTRPVPFNFSFSTTETAAAPS